jgi:hypothetical protein
MLKIKEEQFITDIKGKKISVIIPMKDYSFILNELEELADIRAYDHAKTKKQEFIDADKAFEMIENKRIA